jgi:DNA modification methylase
MKIETISIKDVKLYEKNARTHPKEQIELLAKNIKRFGFTTPILIDKDNNLIAGHGRLLALQQLGDTEAPAVRMEHLTPDEVKALRLADNQVTSLSNWEMDLVIDELKELDPDLFDLTGFDMDLLLEPEEEDDSVPDVPDTAKSKIGDVYEIGGHRVLCGSSTDANAVQGLFDPFKADMWLTDPPYNVDYTGKTKDALKIENDSMDDSMFRQFLVDAYTAADTVMKPGAVFYIWHADSEGYTFRGAAHDIGWKVRQCLIWNKNTMVMGRQDYHWKHEPCLYGWKEGAHLWNSDRTQTTVLEFARPSRSTHHPTMKPVELMAYQITNNTKGEDIIFDSFLGSGSTLIAAEKTGRRCFGIELDPRYVDVTIQRWVDYTGNTTVIKNGVEEEWELSPAPV